MVDHADPSRYRRWSSRGLHLLVVSARPMAYDNFCHRLAAHSREGQHQHRHLSSHGQMLLSSTGRWFTKARITKHPGKPKSKVNLAKGAHSEGPFDSNAKSRCPSIASKGVADPTETTPSSRCPGVVLVGPPMSTSWARKPLAQRQ